MTGQWIIMLLVCNVLLCPVVVRARPLPELIDPGKGRLFNGLFSSLLNSTGLFPIEVNVPDMIANVWSFMAGLVGGASAGNRGRANRMAIAYQSESGRRDDNTTEEDSHIELTTSTAVQ